MSQHDFQPQLKSFAAKSNVYAQQPGDALDLIDDPAMASATSAVPTRRSRRCAARYADLRRGESAVETVATQAARDGSHRALVRSYRLSGGCTLVMLILMPVVGMEARVAA